MYSVGPVFLRTWPLIWPPPGANYAGIRRLRYDRGARGNSAPFMHKLPACPYDADRRPLALWQHGRSGRQVAEERERHALEGDDAVDALREDQRDVVVDHLQRALGHDHDVVVAEPDVVGLELPRVVERRPHVDARRHQPPLVVAAEDDHLPQIAADVPASRQRDGL